MSKNIDQIFIANPITSNASTDLMYFGQSPYGAGNDAAMTFANFSAQFGAPFTPAALTRTNDTNVTVTLGGTPATALLQTTSLTLGWTGQLSFARGGTNANLTAVNGAVVYSTASAMAFTAAGTSGQVLQSAGAASPVWSTSTFPSTAGASGNVLISNGTNYVSSTSLWPNTVGSAGTILRSNGTSNAYSTSTFADTYAVSTILYASGANAVSGLAAAQNGVLVSGNTNVPSMLAGPGTTGNILQSNAAAAPSFSTATYPSVATSAGTMLRANGTNWVASTATFADTYAVSTILYAGSSNAVSGLATVNRASLSTNSTGVPTWLALTDGQVVVGSSAGSPAAATISAGTGISVTNASNSITIASTGVGSLVWNDVSGTSQAAAVNNGYIISNAAQTTVTIPATAAEGSVFAVQGKGAAGWILQMNTGQTVHLGSSASSSAGSLTSTNQWDSVQIVCVTANTTFAVISVIGNLTVA